MALCTGRLTRCTFFCERHIELLIGHRSLSVFRKHLDVKRARRTGWYGPIKTAGCSINGHAERSLFQLIHDGITVFIDCFDDIFKSPCP